MKKLVLVILGVLFFVIVAIISIPYLLSSTMGKRFVLTKISQNIKYSLEADRLYFSWFGPQRAKNLIAISPSEVRYDFPELILQTSLWKLWKKSPSIGVTRVPNLIVTIPQIDEKTNRPDKPIDSVIIDHISCPKTNHCLVFGEIHVTDGLVYLRNLKHPIQIPKLQYLCTPHGKVLHIDIKFLDTTAISHMNLECTASSQDFWFEGKDIPIYLLDALKNLFNGFPIQEIVGPSFNIELNAKLLNGCGPIYWNIYSTNMSITQSGELHSNHYILGEPLTLSLQLSKEMLNSIFHHPILQIDRIEEPIRMNILPQEIPLPLSPSTEINNASIHISKITCINKDLLFHLAAELLHIDDSKIDIWFSEIPVYYAGGILQISRSEIVLQNKYQLAIWGEIDCFQKKVHLKLGIPKSTLKKVFGIKSLPSDYMITCTIKGSFDDIQLDTSKLVKKIAILIAKDKAKQQIWKEGSKVFKDSTDIPNSIKSLPWDSSIEKN